MTVEEFVAWAEDRLGRYELVDGDVITMAPQRAQHARAKFGMQAALKGAIHRAGLPCEMLAGGMTVKIDASTAYEPDALVQCGERLVDDATLATQPIIIVEVLSPSTGRTDSSQKLDGYFRVSSVMHYLIIEPRKRLVIHHRRGDGLIETRIVSSGNLPLSPPGLSLPIADVFADL